WIAKLHGPERSVELEEDFRGWLAASPQNARAFEHMTEIWDSIAQVDVGGMPRVSVRESRDPLDAPKHRLHWSFAAACMFIVALGVAWFVMTDGSYSTGIGEQRIVNLDDGSRIHLNSGTIIDVDIGPTARRLKLERGEAFFDVAKDPTRPFIVTAGERVVTALGTSFVVRFDPKQVEVTLVEGRVAVSEHADEATTAGLKSAISSKDGAQNASDVLILEPGERVTFAETGSAVIDQPSSDATAAWRRGEVVLNDTPLSEAAMEMNRHQRQQLVLEGDAIGELPISGIYRAGNNEDFANAVAVVYDLEVIRVGREIHLRAKR
ncbi:MAG TPA: FecR domain-containing protein, partial [Polyangiaceae bacterium]|nr:FecR domain-containing protein [Polyangiaceae bacterium]